MSIAKSALSLSKTNYNSHPKNKTTVPKFLKKEEIQMLTHILTKKKKNVIIILAHSPLHF